MEFKNIEMPPELPHISPPFQGGDKGGFNIDVLKRWENL